mgnify:FL=1|jgi:hypothetical protein
MAQFFDKFPRISYDIEGKRLTTYQSVTNIFFRVRVIREILGNISAYYEYLIKDDDTPEILADKVYNNPEAHWIILMANNIVDPQYDWPLNSTNFTNYIINKYGSVANAQTTYHHYEKVITREESFSGTITETRFVINQANAAVSMADSTVPYDSYNNLPETQSVNTVNMGEGKTVVEIVNRDRISNYDYEVQVNENKRSIKIIKPEYYGQIIREFDNLTQIKQRTTYLRRLA